MSDVNDERVEFRCSQCSKRLRARIASVGKQVTCPSCGHVVVIPEPDRAIGGGSNQQSSRQPDLESWLGLGNQSLTDSKSSKAPSNSTEEDQSTSRLKRPSLFDVDELVLESDPIADIEQRKAAAQQIQATKEAQRRSKAAQARRRLEEKPGDVTPVTPRSRHQVSESQFRDSYTLLESNEDAESTTPNSSTSDSSEKKSSVFDEDLPELVESDESQEKFSLPGIDVERIAAELDNQAPDGGLSSVSSLRKEQRSNNETYRTSCPNCGALQFAPRSAVGTLIKCSDCLFKFKAPPPAANWMPHTEASLHNSFNEEAWPSQSEEYEEIDRRRHQRTEAMLKHAETELEKEEKENRSLGTDFDTSSFVRQTFGFIFDPIAMGVVLGHGMAFAVIFAMIQYGLSADESYWGRGVALFCLLTAPPMGVLFGLPLISSALAQLESVANRENRVVDWPGFNVFDNLGDALGVASALAAAATPGFIIGTWIGGDMEGSGRIQIAGVMMTTLVLFPIFLLSVLDNNSMLQLISRDVIRSLREVSEAWGSYYLKTLVVFVGILILWLLLLGENKPPFLAAIAGGLLPGLVFFTFQQLGCLADAIGDNLSLLEPDESDDEDAGKGEVKSSSHEKTRTKIRPDSAQNSQ